MNGLHQPWLVSYDISDNRARRRMSELLRDFGLARVQKSVYFGYLTRAELRSLARDARQHLDASTDSLFWARIDLPAVLDNQCLGKRPQLEELDPDGHAIL